ncbi:hypothetical protein [Atopomonas sediminilitoris]|uniref:hypothetical protein n=1 Tax=Atopomonas sediminilitoris TaxID=2919919 RepID=UPI001F4EF0B7|nr:hypothetical protein [Atopomonas sediminilitoris]MCJ8169461.1 hypothetical protein [Atopomonas sediminilitoris]
MKPVFRQIIPLSLLALAIGADAAEHRLAYSKAENVEVFVEHADGQPWCSANLQLRFAFSAASPDTSAVSRLLPKLGGLIGSQCASANQLSWYSSNNAGQRLANGTANQAGGWQAQIASAPATQPAEPAAVAVATAPASAPAPAPAPAPAQSSAEPAANATLNVAPDAPTQVTAPVATTEPVAEQPAAAVSAIPASTDFAVSGWQPLLQKEALANANFLTEIADQNGCRYRLTNKFEDGVENASAKAENVSCGPDGYAQGKGQLVIQRTDGVLLHKFSGNFLSGLALTGDQIPNLPVVGFDDRQNLLLLLLSEPASKVHYLLRLSRNYGESWNADNGLLLAVTENRDLFRSAESIRHTIELATTRLDQAAPNIDRLNFLAMRDLKQGLFQGDRDFWMYEITLDRKYRTREWKYNLQHADNYLFTFERKEAEQQRLAELQRAREAQRQRELLALQAEQQLRLYEKLNKETRKPEELYARLTQDASFTPPMSGSYASMLRGKSVDYRQIVFIKGKTDDGWEIEYPYQAILNTDDSDQDAAEGWFVVKGTASLDDQHLDEQNLPLTLVAATQITACEESACADLRDPLKLIRQELGDPNWTPETAKEIVLAAKSEHATRQGDDQ